MLYVIFVKLKRNFFITNKNLYFINTRKKITNINIKGISVKNSHSLYGFKKTKNNESYNYKFWINLFFSNKGITEKISLSNKKIDVNYTY